MNEKGNDRRFHRKWMTHEIKEKGKIHFSKNTSKIILTI